ncbi:MAG TPA: hypothetical protein EYQ24_10450 [Bacteroidetes bacterium]|nr:hypothetical protein [Bacteroidota bacterium]
MKRPSTSPASGARPVLRKLSEAELGAQRRVDPWAHVAKLQRCAGCGVPVRFLRTERGKKIPVDPWPYEGRWAEPLAGHEDEGFGVLYAVPANPLVAARSGWTGEARYWRNPPSTVTGFRPHHATCPRSEAFRRGRA